MRLILWIVIVTIATTFTGCALVKKEYTYIPPTADAAKRCIAHCVQAKKYCTKICQLKKENCRYHCSRVCDCTPSFNTCYKACDGQVLER